MAAAAGKSFGVPYAIRRDKRPAYTVRFKQSHCAEACLAVHRCGT